MAAITPTYLGEDVGYLRLAPDRTKVRRIKSVLIELAATVDDGDVIQVTLANYGLSNVKAIEGVSHTTVNSVIEIETPTTLTSPTVTGAINITVGGSTDNLYRSFIIFGEEA